MGYLIGGRVINTDTYGKGKKADLVKVPNFKPVQGPPLSRTQDFQARIRSQAADISRTAPTFNDPRYTFTTLSIPTDLRTLNGLYRFFDDTDPIVGNAIRLHTEFPLAGYAFSDCGDSGIKAHYEEMWDRIHGDQLLFDLGLEYWRIGNVFLFGAWNEVDFMWDQFAILNPDYVTVNTTWLSDKPLIKLQPDEALKRIVTTGQPKFLYEQLSPEIIKYVRLGQEIPLDPNNTFFVAHNKAPYEALGKSIIKRLLKMLIYEDRLNMANFAIATRQVIPITIVKLGDPASVEEDHLVTYYENDQLKMKTFKQLWDDYDGTITSHGGGKEVKDVSQYNLKVKSLKEDGMQIWNPIESILRHPTPDKVVEVTTPLSTLRMTEGHGLVRIDPDTLAFEHTTPKQLEEREAPSVVSMDRYEYSVKADKVFDLSLTTDLAYLVGLWTADGSFLGHRNVKGERIVSKKTVQISNKNEGIGSYLVKLPYKISEHISDSDISYHIKFPELVDALVNYYKVPYENGSVGKTGKEKVPQEILFNENKEVVGAFFAGVFDGDGWINNDELGVSCGASKEYHHWLSLALLAQGIQSRVRFRAGAWECKISGKKNRLKFFDLISSYVQHSKKKLYAENYLKSTSVIEHQDKCYVYDLDKKQREILFKDSSYRSIDGSLALTEIKNRKRINRNTISKAGVDCEAKTVCQNLFGMAVTKIERKKKTSKYVYDLMLKDNPHTYLTAGDGWLLTYNSGWIPEDQEIEDVKEMFACHDDQTEVLTENGFKLFSELTKTEKAGCFNTETEKLEYYLPEKYHEYDYDGELIHFKNSKIDAMVTPNHRMWCKGAANNPNLSWHFRRADEVTKNNMRFRSVAEWEGIKPPNTLNIAGKNVDTKTYLKFLGWFLSEGSVGDWVTNKTKKRIYSQIDARISQVEGSEADEIQQTLDTLGFKYNIGHGKTKNGKNYKVFNIKKEFAQFLYDNFKGGAKHKYVPRDILFYDKEHLTILLDALVAGDGSVMVHKQGYRYEFTTTSKQLANNVYEIAFKLGYAPKMVPKFFKNPKWSDWYAVYFSTSNVGKYPSVNQSTSRPNDPPIQKVKYKGKVYCLTVPTGTLITRRNGKICVSGNSREIDPNFSIFYHYGIDVQFYGASGKILNIAPEHDRVRKLKFLGLGISEAMLSGGTATYATAYMNLEVLRQRYLHFQLRMENFVHKGLYEPVAKMCGFYKTNKAVAGHGYKGKVWGDKKAMKYELEKRYAVKTLRDMKDNQEFQEFIKRKAQEAEEFGLVVKPKYIYPRIKWDLLSLTSDVQYRNFLMAFDKMFPGVRKVSDSTYYRVLRLEGENEQRQIEIENAERRDFQFREAKRDKKFKDELIAEGLELPAPPPGVKAPPGAPAPGAPPAAPTPLAPGAPGAPKAPVGKGPAEGEKKPEGIKPGGGPAVLREESVEIQKGLEQKLTKGLSSEVKQLKKANERMLKERDTES